MLIQRKSYNKFGADLTQKNVHWFDDYTQTDQDKSISYTYFHNRLLNMQSSEYSLPTEYMYDDANAHGELVAVKDESGIQTFEYGNMGEITKSTRAYALPTQAPPIAFVTQFKYDSWGRMKTITYPDNETLTYAYDHGGQLKSMQGVKDTYTYNYLLNQKYDKFGAKTEMAYGNAMVTRYMYDSLNLRLDSLVACLQANKYFSMGYRYDAKGNVDTLYSTYSCFNGGQLVTQAFEYDSTDQLTNALGEVNQTTLYSASVSYTNWGKIGRYTTSINGSDTFMYPSTNPVSTHFAPNSSVNNGNTTTYEFGINGSLRKKENNVGTEYYLFNAFNCMKVYSYNGERYGYYGYDASGERMYKMGLSEITVTTNQNGIDSSFIVWNVENMMLYPNGYINVNQDGEYTKHYYADALRIASKLGTGFSGNLCDSTTVIENTYPGYLSNRMTIQYDEIREEINETSEIGDALDDIYGIPYPNFCNLSGNQAQETDIFYYHPDHLGSTGMVTDNNANIQQGFLYAPFGEILQEYSGLNYNVIPKFAFNAKQYDEENNMYYYSARYYAPPTFISRDPMFEKYPNISPYTYCNNNPVNAIDPTGEFPYPPKGVGIISLKGNLGVGNMWGVSGTVQRGMAVDKHGMTHFSGYSVLHGTNQNLYEGSSNPAFLAGGGGGVGPELAIDFSANSFLEAMNNYSTSGTGSAKFGVGGSFGLGEKSFSIGAAIGFEIALKGGGTFKFNESISLSKNEADKAGEFSLWSVSSLTLQKDKKGNSYFEGTVMSEGLFGSKSNTGIKVRCSAVKTDKGYIPSEIWMSKEYEKSVKEN